MFKGNTTGTFLKIQKSTTSMDCQCFKTRSKIHPLSLPYQLLQSHLDTVQSWLSTLQHYCLSHRSINMSDPCQ